MIHSENLRVLCIDDAHDKLIMMRIILKRAGHKVHTTTSVQRGLHLLRKYTLDVVLVNYLMPHTSGLDFIEYLASNEALDGVGVVFNSAVSQWALPVEHGAWPRVDVSLGVPFLPADLLKAVHDAYAQRQQNGAQSSRLRAF